MKKLMLIFIAIAVMTLSSYAGPHSKEYLDKKRCYDQYELDIKKSNSCEELDKAKQAFIISAFTVFNTKYTDNEKLSQEEEKELDNQMRRIQNKVDVLRDHWDCGPEETNATTEEKEPVDDQIYSIVEEMPEFPGGMSKMAEYISHHLVYPMSAWESGTQGRVMVSAVVEKDGSLSNVQVMRSLNAECDKEAVNVVKGMPKWKPGKNRGKTVRVSYTIPISFIKK